MTARPPGRRTTLVVGYSPDLAGEWAVTVAADLARRLGAYLLVLHVITPGDYPVDPDAADWDEHAARELARQRTRVSRALARHDGQWDNQTRRGDPARELCRAADEHDALPIVVGTRGEGLRTVVTRMLDRSVSHAVIGHQHRPVLVVPPPEPTPGWHDADLAEDPPPSTRAETTRSHRRSP